MSEFPSSSQAEVEIAHTAAIIEDQLRVGFFVDIASAKVDVLPENLTPQEVAEVILPEPKGSAVLEPRWTLVDKAEAAEPTKTAIAVNGESIISTVEALSLRKLVNGERQAEDIKIDPEKAIFIVEGGANKTSVVRRGVAVKAMHELYGDDLSSKTLYQLGGERIISPTREVSKPDGTKETMANAEHKTILDLAGDFLPAEGAFTEFDANLATALAEGYEISTTYDTSDDDAVSRKLELTHADTAHPRLVLIQPAGKGLEAGFDALKSEIEDDQLVISTNGQYREKDVYQAEMWAKANGIGMLPTISLGDEPGDSFPFGDSEVVVPNRPEAAYINELVILYRLAMKRLPDIEKEAH
jgi:hypothetical protein